MIPKIIHYCWFGGNPLPESAKKCIASWRNFLPDYEIKEWNESNFDVNSIKYTREAYKLKKYAFVSDYARMWILYNYGGLYFDTDVELIKPIDDIIARGNFMGREAQDNKVADNGDEVSSKDNKPTKGQRITPGLGLGVAPGLGLYKKIINWYQTHHFATWDGKFSGTVVDVVSDIFDSIPMKKLESGILFAADVYIYPPEYFCPKNYFSGEMHITENTRSIHHYSATWVRKRRPLMERLKKRISFIRAYYNL